MLVGLPPEFDAVITLLSFSSEPLPLQRLIDVLLEYESQYERTVQDVPLYANLLEVVLSSALVGSIRGDRPPSRGRARGFQSRI